MPRDYKVYLEDILEAVRKIRQFTSGLSFEGFTRDAKTLDAVIRNLEVIGEATKKIPEDIRAKQSDVDWKRGSAELFFNSDGIRSSAPRRGE